jgi:predicted permease
MRHALRALRASPGVTAVATLSLALGIGANTAIFGLIDAVMLRPLSLSHPEELVEVTLATGFAFNNRVWEQVRDKQDVFSGVFAYGRWAFNLAPGGEVRTVNGHFVSADYFDTLRIQAALGRTLMSADDKPGCPGVAMLRYGFWQSEYGGDDKVIGKTISIDRHPIEIVGVAPRGFTGVEVGTTADVMVPICAERLIHGENTRLDVETLPGFFKVIGRLKPGVTAAQASARLKTLAADIYKATLPSPGKMRPEEYSRYLAGTFDIEPAQNGLSYLRGQYREALLVLLGMVAIVLLISCANVANLLLARGVARQREISIRMSLGCGRGRLIWHSLSESLLLSGMGAALGMVFAEWGTRLVTHYLDAFLDLTPDWRVLAFTAGAAIVTSLLCGIAPAWRLVRGQSRAAIIARPHRIIEGSRMSLGKVLVAAQVALSMFLVAGAGLMLSTFWRLASLDPGFDRDHVLLVGIGVPNGHGSSVYARVLEKLRAIPGVRAASLSDIFPICHCGWTGGLEIEGNSDSAQDAVVHLNQVSDQYFATLGTGLLAGRDFDDHDTPSSPRVAIISQAMAEKYFGTVNPLGKYIRTSQAGRFGEGIEIVGIVQDAKYGSLRDDIAPTIYTSWNQIRTPGPLTKFELRSSGSAPAALAPGVKAAIAEIDPRISIEFTTLAEQLDDSISRERLLAWLSGIFGSLALLLASVGLYGVTSYNVARRTNEVGIRMALGADPGRVKRMVLREIGILVSIGLAIGLIAAVAGTRVVQGFLYGVSPNDVSNLCAGAVILTGAAALAGWFPARRASRLDPMSALREE